MSKADMIFAENCRHILEHGFSDEGMTVRPHWEDGTPAHTVKAFGIVNRYDLREEFPLITLRRQYLKSAIDELLWIWQKKSNNVHDLKSHVWDAWADKTGSIGKAYGYQLGQRFRHHKWDGKVPPFSQYPSMGLKDGWVLMDQVDAVLYDLRTNRASRRILTNIFNHQDLADMGLQPCAYSMTFNVSGNVLNGILNQRSQDMLTANGWNVMQYAALLIMIAQATGLVAGELVHVIADCHIYDRHIPIVRELIEREAFPAPKVTLDPTIVNFYQFTPDSFRVEGYQYNELEDKIPVAI